MKFILGKKINMTQLFDEKGNVIPVTKVEAGPCLVTQVKNSEKDGYISLQLGFDNKKNISKPVKGHLKGLDESRYLREFRIEETGEIKRGDKITVGTFEVGDKIKVVGTSKGKGFQGVVRRHGFKGHPKTHGHKDQERMGGSVGPTAPARVFRGMRMPGHMGADQVTVKNLEIIQIDTENNLFYIKGAIPGHKDALVMISANGDLKVNIEPVKKEEAPTEKNEVEEVKNEETKTEASTSEIKEETTPAEEKTEDKKDESVKEETKEIKEEVSK